jgi:hypothetical protein
LTSINEENEIDMPKDKSVTKTKEQTKFPFAAGFKKLKDKDKDKEKDKASAKNSVVTEMKEASKRTTAKDKILSKNISSSDMTDSEKNSPQTLLKRKSSNMDIANGPIASEYSPIQTMTNGVNNSDSGLTTSERGSMDVGESFDSGNDMLSNSSMRPSISADMKNHGSIQVSQV